MMFQNYSVSMNQKKIVHLDPVRLFDVDFVVASLMIFVHDIQTRTKTQVEALVGTRVGTRVETQVKTQVSFQVNSDPAKSLLIHIASDL